VFSLHVSLSKHAFVLQGKWNVIGEMDREAKELAYGVPAKEVDQIFGKQQEEFFFPGPRRQWPSVFERVL